MILVIAADRWPNPTKTTLVHGPEDDPARAKKEFFMAKESGKHAHGATVLLYFEAQPQSVSIARVAESKPQTTKGNIK